MINKMITIFNDSVNNDTQFIYPKTTGKSTTNTASSKSTSINQSIIILSEQMQKNCSHCTSIWGDITCREMTVKKGKFLVFV